MKDGIKWPVYLHHQSAPASRARASLAGADTLNHHRTRTDATQEPATIRVLTITSARRRFTSHNHLASIYPSL